MPPAARAGTRQPRLAPRARGADDAAMRAHIIVLAWLTLAPIPPMAARADPPVEDEAHRLDRLETKRLNERAATQRPTPPDVPATTAGRPSQAMTMTADEAALRRREMEAIAAWRQQVELCRRGVRSAC